MEPANLEEIYKLVKTTENRKFDEEEDEENFESIQKANEMYESMLKKLNASEDLLA